MRHVDPHPEKGLLFLPDWTEAFASCSERGLFRLIEQNAIGADETSSRDSIG